MSSLQQDFCFIDSKISVENIGEHDADNRFLCEDIHDQMKCWRELHPNCTPVGVCYDETMRKYGFFPMVYEDEDGSRFYTHIDIATIREYLELEQE